MISNGQTLHTGTFLRALRRLNPELRVCSFENSHRLAGLYLIRQGEWEDICGVDKEYVPAYATFDDGGHIVKSGWRRVFWILLGNKYTDESSIRKVCPGFFDSRARKYDRFVGGVIGDPVNNKITKFLSDNNAGDPFGEELLRPDQLLDIAQDLRARDSQALREEREHDKWFLETWKQKGGGTSDRPNY